MNMLAPHDVETKMKARNETIMYLEQGSMFSRPYFRVIARSGTSARIRTSDEVSWLALHARNDARYTDHAEQHLVTTPWPRGRLCAIHYKTTTARQEEVS